MLNFIVGIICIGIKHNVCRVWSYLWFLASTVGLRTNPQVGDHCTTHNATQPLIVFKIKLSQGTNAWLLEKLRFGTLKTHCLELNLLQTQSTF